LGNKTTGAHYHHQVRASGDWRDGTLYDGKSASYMYDSRFSPGPELSSKELSDHTPQGVAWWKNWDGKGNDLLLVSTCGKGKAHIVGLDPKAGDKTVGTVDMTSSRGAATRTKRTPVPSR
jgi:hypothetical protein